MPRALVIGASGGIGGAIAAALRTEPWRGAAIDVACLGRSTTPALDLLDETSIAAAAARLSELDLVIDATGFLHGDGFAPEKTWRHLDSAHMAHAFAVNAIGPALLMKHLLPRLSKDGAVFATLSARVGSIGDNRLGGWHSYRASKAALNQIVRTVSIELRRTNPAACLVAIHPGTVDTGLSTPFAKTGLDVQTPAEAAARILAVLARLGPDDSGGFLDHLGKTIPF